jgi:hypothetical protein
MSFGAGIEKVEYMKFDSCRISYETCTVSVRNDSLSVSFIRESHHKSISTPGHLLLLRNSPYIFIVVPLLKN